MNSSSGLFKMDPSISAPVTHIHFVLDRSGSMAQCLDDTIGGVNTFLQTQRDLKDAGDCTVSIYLFDHEYTPYCTETNIRDVKNLDRTTYVPRGQTALHDAIGRTINHAASCNYKSTDKIVIVILTDGFENNSREFNNKTVAELIKKYDALDNWSFVYLAANQDAITAASQYGIQGSSAMTFAQSAGGVRQCYNNLGDAMTRYRTAAPAAACSKVSFTQEEQTNATI